jgi:hypothetical protein
MWRICLTQPVLFRSVTLPKEILLFKSSENKIKSIVNLVLSISSIRRVAKRNFRDDFPYQRKGESSTFLILDTEC